MRCSNAKKDISSVFREADVAKNARKNGSRSADGLKCAVLPVAGRRAGAARLLGEAWEDDDSDASRGRRGWSSSLSGGVGLGLGAGAAASQGTLAGTPSGSLPGSLQDSPAAQAQVDQQLVNAVGGLGKRQPRDQSPSAPASASAWATRSTAPSPAIFTALGSVGAYSGDLEEADPVRNDLSKRCRFKHRNLVEIDTL